MEGNGMKLIKIHLLHHFSTMICLFGCAKKIDTFIPEKNHKNKVKEHARRTQCQSIDFEYQTARKDYKDCVLHSAECKVLSIDPDSIMHMFIGIYKEDEMDNTTILQNMRSGVGFYIDFDNADVFLGRRRKVIQWNSNFFPKAQLITFLKENNILVEYTQTQFNTVLDNEVVKLHGDPTINHHDWVIADNAWKTVICHILCFVTVSGTQMFYISCWIINGTWTVCHLSFC